MNWCAAGLVAGRLEGTVYGESRHAHTLFEGRMEERENQLMDVAELARRLNVRESWVYGQCRQRKATGFPVIKLGKYLRFNYSDVIKWGQRNDS